ncbi:MAG: methyltransferase domain-containing protein [Bacteroidetes bacterium]|nr:methyltransferase domain-containing protein [Bacteroidota bacterium]MBP7399217.1 methyltransferase domain-containing protein [Chitinophagales bacterium]MBK7108984.1 methyltransferase domain-containing protein [Bacteroidota bacterium]MBK8488691.1 methyltransferase domain-containing protein [Bacteroidota bacterium]MBK8681553.1 methyltransferase domain-containing protein [Bacteroidota bacterium]
MKKTLKWNIAQKAELQWWENYLKGKNVEEYHAWKRKYWQGLLDKISSVCPIENGMSVLDAGCGPAGVFMNLQQCKVDAIDPLLDNYNKTLPHFKTADYPYVTFFNTPMEQFATDNKYDIVFCMNAINHVIDIKHSYQLLGKWVKPGGKLVVTIDAHNHSFFKHLFRLIPGDILHPHQYDLKEYAAFITDNGFKMLQTEKLKSEFFFDHYMQVAEK